MTSELTVLGEVAARLRYQMWHAVPVDVASEAGISVGRFGPVLATVVRSQPEDRCLNRVLGASERGAVSDGHLADAIDWMDSEGVDYSVPVVEGRSASIRAVAFLGKRGFVHESNSLTYMRGMLPPRRSPDPAVKIYPLGGDEGDGFGLCQIADEVFGLAPAAWALLFALPTQEDWHCYTAASQRQPLSVKACGAMFTSDGIARFGVDAALESARDAGLTEALLHRRLLDAVDAGCQISVAEIAECDAPGHAAMLRALKELGFGRGYRTQYWTRAASPATSGGPSAAYWLGV